VLDTGVILKTGTPEGAWSWLNEGSTADATKQRTANRAEALLKMNMANGDETLTPLTTFSLLVTTSNCQKLRAIALIGWRDLDDHAH